MDTLRIQVIHSSAPLLYTLYYKEVEAVRYSTISFLLREYHDMDPLSSQVKISLVRDHLIHRLVGSRVRGLFYVAEEYLERYNRRKLSTSY